MTMARMPERRRLPSRVAMVSVHTSPLDQPGTGDAGGMNVYVVELVPAAGRARRRGRHLHPGDQLRPAAGRSSWRPACTVRHVTAGPFEGLAKEDLPAQLCAFTAGADAHRGRAARPAGTTSCTPTTGSPARSAGWPPSAGTCRSSTRCTRWPRSRTSRWPRATRRSRWPARSARRRSSTAADRLVANTDEEADQLVELYDADPARVAWSAGRRPRPVPPGSADRRPPRASALPRRRLRAAVRRPDPAAQGARRAAARGRPAGRATTRAAPTGWSSPSSAARRGSGLARPERAAAAGRPARPRRPRALRRRRSRSDQLAGLVPRRRPDRRAVVQRVVRAGRDRVAGLRHAGRRGRRRRAAHRGRRRRLRCAGRRPRPRRLRRACSATSLHDPDRPRRAGPRRAAARRRGSAGPRPRPGCSRSTPTRCSSGRPGGVPRRSRSNR